MGNTCCQVDNFCDSESKDLVGNKFLKSELSANIEFQFNYKATLFCQNLNSKF